MRGEAEYLPEMVRDRAGTTGTKLLIAVPFYKNEELVAPVLESLIACAADLAEINAEIVLFDDSPGYAPLQAALEEMLPKARSTCYCSIPIRSCILARFRKCSGLRRSIR